MDESRRSRKHLILYPPGPSIPIFPSFLGSGQEDIRVYKDAYVKPRCPIYETIASITLIPRGLSRAWSNVYFSLIPSGSYYDLKTYDILCPSLIVSFLIFFFLFCVFVFVRVHSLGTCAYICHIPPKECFIYLCFSFKMLSYSGLACR